MKERVKTYIRSLLAAEKSSEMTPTNVSLTVAQHDKQPQS